MLQRFFQYYHFQGAWNSFRPSVTLAGRHSDREHRCRKVARSAPGGRFSFTRLDEAQVVPASGQPGLLPTICCGGLKRPNRQGVLADVSQHTAGMSASVCVPCTLHRQPLTPPRDDRGWATRAGDPETGQGGGGDTCFVYESIGWGYPGASD